MGLRFLRHSIHATQCGQWVSVGRPILWSFERVQSATLGLLALYFPFLMLLAFVHAPFRNRARCCLKIGADRLGPVNLHNTEHLSPLSYHVNCSTCIYCTFNCHGRNCATAHHHQVGNWRVSCQHYCRPWSMVCMRSLVVHCFLSVTPSTKSTKFDSRYLIGVLPERDEILQFDRKGLAVH